MSSIDIVLVRHGESEWNKDNRFCGWVDVALSERGIEEAYNAAKLLKESGYIEFEKVHTSLLNRSTETARIIIEELNKENKAIKECDEPLFQCVNHWRLNERHYGNLTGLNKIEMVNIHGLEKVMEWRRSYDSPPPPITENNPYYSDIVENKVFKGINPPIDIPTQETLKDLVIRTIPFWTEQIIPDLQKGKSILIVAHGTSLRGLVKHIEDLDEEAVRKLNLPNGIPFVYNIDRSTLRPTGRRKYLADENVVQEAVEKVLNMGMKA